MSEQRLELGQGSLQITLKSAHLLCATPRRSQQQGERAGMGPAGPFNTVIPVLGLLLLLTKHCTEAASPNKAPQKFEAVHFY